MMTEPPKSEGSEGSEENCPICNKPKSKHTPEKVLECSKKMREFQDAKEDKSEK
ncbi:hypothetical protein MnTg01_00870 [archaeon MnTg01]|nr:hypothetical protein MnTg01_00870 [archaeon MnTg01]